MNVHAVLAPPVKKLPLAERFVQSIEEISPAIPFIACMMWGILLVLLSYAFHIAVFPYESAKYGSKSLGWINEFNWSSTFCFFIPFSLFFSFSTFSAIPEVITTLANGQMIRDAGGRLADATELLASWRHRAGRIVYVAAGVALLTLILSWHQEWSLCFQSGQKGDILSWQRAIQLQVPEVGHIGLDCFGFLAYTSQAVAVALFCYYILIIVTFANWVHDYTGFEAQTAIYPDLTEDDTRFGFERFGPLIENILLASLAYFFQFFMTRLYYIFVADHTANSMFDIVTRSLGGGFGDNLISIIQKHSLSQFDLFEIGGSSHFQNTLMAFGMLIIVASATVVPMIIVSQAAERSRVRLQEMFLKRPQLATEWYGLDLSEARKRIATMTLWPIRYARPMELLLMIVMATACFFFYKLFLILAGYLVWRGLSLFYKRFGE